MATLNRHPLDKKKLQQTMPSRLLPYAFGFNDSQHEDQPPADFETLCSVLTKQEWKTKNSGEVFLYVHDGTEKLFVVIPEGENFEVNIRIHDRFGLLGMMGKEQSLELGFGLLELEDACRLLKLFFDDNYPALRSLHKGMDLK